MGRPTGMITNGIMRLLPALIDIVGLAGFFRSLAVLEFKGVTIAAEQPGLGAETVAGTAFPDGQPLVVGGGAVGQVVARSVESRLLLTAFGISVNLVTGAVGAEFIDQHRQLDRILAGRDLE